MTDPTTEPTEATTDPDELTPEERAAVADQVLADNANLEAEYWESRNREFLEALAQMAEPEDLVLYDVDVVLASGGTVELKGLEYEQALALMNHDTADAPHGSGDELWPGDMSFQPDLVAIVFIREVRTVEVDA